MGSAKCLMAVRSVTKGFDILLVALHVHIDIVDAASLWTQKALSSWSALAVAPHSWARPIFVLNENPLVRSYDKTSLDPIFVNMLQEPFRLFFCQMLHFHVFHVGCPQVS